MSAPEANSQGEGISTLLLKIVELEAQLRQEREDRDRWKTENYAGAQLYAQYRREVRAELNRYELDLDTSKAQVAQLQLDLVQLASELNIARLGPQALDAAANWSASTHKERDLL